MEVLLNPKDNENLKALYNRAFKRAEEIYIATAFLTDWSFSQKPKKDCKKFVALVGTNFGLTRKAACQSLLEWLPRNLRGNVFAFPSNENTFHPKVLIWKERKECFALIGSSNMTSAALSENYEINSFSSIGQEEYERIVQWFNGCIKLSDPISKSWIAKYEESKIGGKRVKGEITLNQIELNIKLPRKKGFKDLLNEREDKQEIFKEKKAKILRLLRSNATGSKSNADFWTEFTQLWHRRWEEEDCFRFQGSGVERTSTKNNNWQEVTTALLDIIENEKKMGLLDLDQLVAEKIDLLAKRKNPARNAWFSEMLCQFFPDKYPVLNDPVRIWIKKKKWSLDRGGTEGQKYIDLARRLRSVVRQNSNYVKDLAGIDTLIWRICPPKKKKSKKL